MDSRGLWAKLKSSSDFNVKALLFSTSIQRRPSTRTCSGLGRRVQPRRQRPRQGERRHDRAPLEVVPAPRVLVRAFRAQQPPEPSPSRTRGVKW